MTYRKKRDGDVQFIAGKGVICNEKNKGFVTREVDIVLLWFTESVKEASRDVDSVRGNSSILAALVSLGFAQPFDDKDGVAWKGTDKYTRWSENTVIELIGESVNSVIPKNYDGGKINFTILTALEARGFAQRVPGGNGSVLVWEPTAKFIDWSEGQLREVIERGVN